MKPEAKLYGIGVGPGDPGLLTLKALRLLQQVDVVLAPCSQPDGESRALNTVMEFLTPRQTVRKLHFSMSPDMAAREESRRRNLQVAMEGLARGEETAFITEGDPLLYSTFQYLLAELPDEVQVEVIPGISSISSAAAAALFPLACGSGKLLAAPAASILQEDVTLLLERFETLALFKVRQVLDEIIDILEACGCLEEAVLVENASQPYQVIHRDVKALKGKTVGYMSLLLVPGRRRHEARYED